MELKTSYQYTYFIYPYILKENGYKKYVESLLKNKNYQIKYFDSFKDIELYKYFIPNIKEKFFQDFTFTEEKVKKIRNFNAKQQAKLLENQSCLIFDYKIPDLMQGKTEEKDGIFFTISKIELVCFNTGICFLLIKTHLEEKDFGDILNFNYKFQNIKLEEKRIKKLDNIKIQTDTFSNMKQITQMISCITGQEIEKNKLDIDEDIFKIYTYACIEANFWNREKGFENIENEFIKLSEVKPNDININVDYNKLTILTDTSFRKIRINDKGVFTVCSAIDKENFTNFLNRFENQYLYTYIISLHQRYYLKKLNNTFNKKTRKTIKEFLNFTNNIWINEITTDNLGEKIYKRCKEKNNLEELFNTVKSKYDIFYKKLKIEEYEKKNKIVIALLIICLILGISNLASWIFLK